MKVPQVRYSHSEGGSTMVAVLVALGIMSLITVLYSSGSKNNLQAKRLVEAKEHYAAIEAAVVAEAHSIVAGLSPTACLASSSLTERPFAFGDIAGKMRYGTKFTVQGAVSSKTKDAVNRCAKPIFITPARINDPKYSRLHFCMSIDRLASEASDTTQSFIEYEVRLVSTSTNLPLSCGTFLKDRSAIAQVAYGMYLFDDGRDAIKQGITIIRSPVKGSP